MKKPVVLLFCFLFLSGYTALAQITITQSDLQSYLALGHTVSAIDDTSTTSLNIGNTGATSWNFSGLHYDRVYTLMSVAPSSTPLGSHFPSSTISLFDTTNIQGYELQSWVYLGINNGLLIYGSAGQGSVSGFQITFLSHNNPASNSLVVPITMNTNWSEDYVKTDTTIISPLPPSSSITNFHHSYVVDAYGNMTLPGGATVPALRLKTDTRSYMLGGGGFYSRDISYLFLTTSGTQVEVEAADTTSPNTGVIPVRGITFINAGITAVQPANNNIPNNFNLEQNYPNPFNPSTMISYSIPSSQKVTLKVYDELGREVVTLVNSEQAAGNYNVSFNATGFASGVYFYKLQAGSFIQIKKMILMK